MTTKTKKKIDLTDTALAHLLDEAAQDHYVEAGCTGCAFYRQLDETADALRARHALTDGKDRE